MCYEEQGHLVITGEVAMAAANMKDQVQAELTTILKNREHFLDRYRVLPPEELRVSG